MREQMGPDRVYDVIDEWLEDVPLVRLIESAIDTDDESASARETDAALSTASNERAGRLMALQKKTSLASRLDLRSARELRDASDERRLQPLFIQRFFERAWTACGGTVRKDDQFPVWHIGSTPTALPELARERRQPLSDNYDTPFVFDKQLVSVASKVRVPERTKLMGPGHPLFDTLIEWAIREARQAFAKGAILVDPNIAKPQRVWLVRSTIEDGRRQWRQDRRKPPAHERLAVVVQDHLGLRTTSPSYMLNCIAPESIEDCRLSIADFLASIENGQSQIENRKSAIENIQSWAYEQITERQLDQVKAVRAEECDLRRAYLNTAFTDLILELQEDLNDLQQAQLYGDDNAEERERLRQRVEDLKARKADRLKELELMMKLTANLPDLLTEAVIAPVPVATVESDEEAPSKGVPMRRDDEVEAIAMDVTMRYERARGWSPMDVSRDGEHYDVRSEGPGGEKRFIEVKGRARSGAIVLTGPEVDKLRQLGERAWLYVVTFCKHGLSGVEGGDPPAPHSAAARQAGRPRLRIIQDPISRLNPEMLYRQIQYLIEEDDWRAHGEEVSRDAVPDGGPGGAP